MMFRKKRMMQRIYIYIYTFCDIFFDVRITGKPGTRLVGILENDLSDSQVHHETRSKGKPQRLANEECHGPQVSFWFSRQINMNTGLLNMKKQYRQI